LSSLKLIFLLLNLITFISFNKSTILELQAGLVINVKINIKDISSENILNFKLRTLYDDKKIIKFAISTPKIIESERYKKDNNKTDNKIKN
jgi:hypothetical protein